MFHELLPGREEQDRQHIVWVILGNRIYKTSIHSVRPLSEKEQAIFEAQGDNSHLWKQLSDVIPRREFIDITGEIPGPDEVQEPVLPEDPNESTVIKPKVRFTEKGHPSEEGYPPNYVPLPPPAPDPEDSELVNEYLPDAKRAKLDTEDTEDNEEKIPSPESLPGSRRASTSSKTPLLEESKEDKDKPEEGVIDDTPVPEPEVKKARTDEDSDPDQEDLAIHLDLNQAILDIGEGYVMNIDLDFSSNRQKKQFEKDPIAYLAKKVNGAEVNYKRLSPEERQLSENAKGGEVSSFVKTIAVRRCLDYEESQRARQSGRVLRARWVLVWKDVPEEEKEKALEDRQNNPLTVYNKDATKKAKARIVLFGFQHPDLELPEFRTTSPVQSQLMKHLSLFLAAQKKWSLESLDMKTAFLQTGADDMEQKELWTPGVPELRKALGAEDHEVLRILRNIYGNATAPRGLWEDVDKKLVSLGGHKLIGDNSFWVWTEKNENPRNAADAHRVIGFMGGHVDDVQRAGDLDNPTWLEVRKKIDEAYRWRTKKENSFCLTGVDLTVHDRGQEHWIEMNQDFYLREEGGERKVAGNQA